MKIGIVGSRLFTDYKKFKEELLTWIEKDDNNIISSIISGNCNGSDKMAEKYAEEYNIPILIFKPNWKEFGRSAGPIRNSEIVNNSDHIIAFVSKDSVGTWDTINKANKQNISVTIIKLDTPEKPKHSIKFTPIPPKTNNNKIFQITQKENYPESSHDS